jgi:hypothetical protein
MTPTVKVLKNSEKILEIVKDIFYESAKCQCKILSILVCTKNDKTSQTEEI